MGKMDEATRKRVRAGRLMLAGKTPAEAAKLVGVARQTAYTWKARLDEGGVFFVVRSKCHVNFRVVYSRPVDKTTGLRCDQTVRLGRGRSRTAFPGRLRRVRVYDKASTRSLVFLTNQFELPASTVAETSRMAKARRGDTRQRVGGLLFRVVGSP